MMKKVFLNKKLLISLLLIFIMALGGSSYSWVSYADKTEDFGINMGTLFARARLVDYSGNDFSDGDPVWFEYSVSNPLDDAVSKYRAPIVFAFDLSGLVYITSDENGDPLLDENGEPLSEDKLETEDLMSMFERGILNIECEEEDGFSAYFDDDIKLQKAWLENVNSNSENSGKLYCFLLPGNEVRLKISFSFNDDPDIDRKYQRAFIDHNLSFLATQFDVGAMESKFGIDSFFNEVEKLDFSGESVRTLAPKRTVADVANFTDVSEMEDDQIDSEKGRILDIDYMFIKSFAPSNKHLSESTGHSIVSEFEIDETSPWNPENPGNEVYRQLMEYLDLSK